MPTKHLAWGMQRGRAAAPLPRLRYYTAHLADHSTVEFRAHPARVKLAKLALGNGNWLS